MAAAKVCERRKWKVKGTGAGVRKYVEQVITASRGNEDEESMRDEGRIASKERNERE